MTTAWESDALVVEALGEAETEALGAALARLVRPSTVLGMVGPLGAGKTRLSRAISEALGADPAAISSPTYVLIHEYEAALPIFHVDAYRLSEPEEFDALGAGEMLDAGGLCLVEWADRVAASLPRSAWRVEIRATSGSARAFRFSGPGPWAELADLLGAPPR